MPDSGSERAGRVAALAWLAHPVTLVSLAVLLLNDHVLKDRYPGVITGKLSDVAGLILMPAALGALAAALVSGRAALVPGRAASVPGRAAVALRRAALVPGRAASGRHQRVLIPVLVTGLGFALVKAFPAGAAVASAGWTALVGPSEIRADVTDLLTLPALGLAAWVGLRRPPGGAASRRGAGALVTLVLLPIAALAVAATSAPYYPEAVEVTARQGVVVAGEKNAYDKGVPTADSWRVSEDGGRTWRRTDPTSPIVDSHQQGDRQPQHGCAPEAPDHCYRIVAGHLRLEETVNGGTSWWVAWTVTDEQRSRLARQYDDLGDVAKALSSRALAVVAVPGGHAVVVANGRDGYAVRASDGKWSRIGFGTVVRDDGTIDTDPAPPIAAQSLRDAGPEAMGGILAGLLAVAAAACVALWRNGPRWLIAVVVPVLLLTSGLAMLGAVGVRNTNDVVPAILTAFGAVLSAGVAYAALCYAAATHALRWQQATVVALVGPAIAGVGVAAFAAWTGGAFGHRPAGLVTVAATVLGLALALRLVTRERPVGTF
jgi:hypothetical protein